MQNHEQTDNFDLHAVQTTSFEEHLRVKQKFSGASKENPAGLSQSELMYTQGLAIQGDGPGNPESLLTPLTLSANDLRPKQQSSTQAQRLSLLQTAYESTQEKQANIAKLMKRKRRTAVFKKTPNKKNKKPVAQQSSGKTTMDACGPNLVGSGLRAQKFLQENASPNSSAKRGLISKRRGGIKNPDSAEMTSSAAAIDLRMAAVSPMLVGSEGEIKETLPTQDKPIKQFGIDSGSSGALKNTDMLRICAGYSDSDTSQATISQEADSMLKPRQNMVKLPCSFDHKSLRPPEQSSDEKETEQQSRSGGVRTNRVLALNEVLMDSELEVDSEQFDLLSCSAQTQSRVKADRFIPLRMQEYDCVEKSHLQFGHEQGVLRFQTQCRNKRAKKRLPNWALFEDDQAGFQDDASTQLRSAHVSSPGENSNSTKDSPGEVKNKAAFQSLLAQQCLGDEIMQLGNGHQNLTDTMFDFNPLNLDSQVSKKDEALTEIKLRNGPKTAMIAQSANLLTSITNSSMVDPFQSDSFIKRDNLGAKALRNCQSGIGENQGSPGTKETLAFQQSRNGILTLREPRLVDPVPEDPLRVALDIGQGQDWSAFQSTFDCIDGGSQAKPRRIAKTPYKVLDAPQLQDDFYLNLVDWSSQNVLAVGLNRAVYVWSACTSSVSKLCEVDFENRVTSVAWSNKGNHVAVGSDEGTTEIWDVNQNKVVRTLSDHLGRISALAWNGSILSSGSRDRLIISNDLRIKNAPIKRHVGHKQEICGLKWSPDGCQLASGGNDNKLMIWNLQNGQSPVAKFGQHKAAVKAIAWHPNQAGLLATGGGTADRCIRFWNTHTYKPISCVDTGSQVCNLMFSKTSSELVSTHGYSQNQILVWDYPSMRKVATLTGHTYRVLYLAMSPCGSNIVTGAGDETLRFWNLFPSLKSQSASSMLGGLQNCLLH